MKPLLLIASLLLLPLPANAQEAAERNAQMRLMQQNFMKRQGITKEDLENKAEKQDQRIEHGNKEYRDAVLDAMAARKLQLQGRK